MIVAMQEHASEEQIDTVIGAMEEAGVNVHRTTGTFQTILAGVGPTASLDLSTFEQLPGVLHVHRISAPYKLAGRAFRPPRLSSQSWKPSRVPARACIRPAIQPPA